MQGPIFFYIVIWKIAIPRTFFVAFLELRPNNQPSCLKDPCSGNGILETSAR